MTKTDQIIQALINKDTGRLRSLFARMGKQEVLQTLQKLQPKLLELPNYKHSPFPADRQWTLREAIAYISTPQFAEHFLKIFRTRQ